MIPQGNLPEDEGNLREWVVDLGHSGHLDTAATKRLLRLRLWFPGMDKMIEDPRGEVIITNDGATILKELRVTHPCPRCTVPDVAQQSGARAVFGGGVQG